MDEVDLVPVERFILRCNELLAGRFLDLKQKLELLMQNITQSDAIMTYLADALDEYDADVGFKVAFPEPEGGKIKINLPKDDKQRLALTVCVFNDIDSGKLNLVKFLETYFKGGSLTPMQNFLSLFIKPFRDTIAKNFEVDVNITEEDVNEHAKNSAPVVEEVEPEIPGLDEFLEQMKALCASVLSQLKFEKKKETADAEFIVNSTVRACELRDLTVVNGLVIGLNYIAKKLKSIRFFVEQMTTLLYNFYESLESEEEPIEEEQYEYESEENLDE